MGIIIKNIFPPCEPCRTNHTTSLTSQGRQRLHESFYIFLLAKKYKKFGGIRKIRVAKGYEDIFLIIVHFNLD